MYTIMKNRSKSVFVGLCQRVTDLSDILLHSFSGFKPSNQVLNLHLYPVWRQWIKIRTDSIWEIFFFSNMFKALFISLEHVSINFCILILELDEVSKQLADVQNRSFPKIIYLSSPGCSSFVVDTWQEKAKVLEPACRGEGAWAALNDSINKLMCFGEFFDKMGRKKTVQERTISDDYSLTITVPGFLCRWLLSKNMLRFSKRLIVEKVLAMIWTARSTTVCVLRELVEGMHRGKAVPESVILEDHLRTTIAL